MGNLTAKGLSALLKKKPRRYPDGLGLHFKVVADNKAYWTYRYTLKRGDHELSIGPFPETTLDQARIKHAAMRAAVLAKTHPRGPSARNGKTLVTATGVPTFGVMALDHVETHESAWRSAKHRRQWRQTLTQFCQPIWDMPVNEVTTADVLAVLKPLWTLKSVTAGRLRGRIEVIIDAARVLNHIDQNIANPARWKGHLQRLLPKPAKLTHGHHKAMPYRDVPAFMEKLAGIDTIASAALRLIVLTAARSGEVINMTFDEISFDDAVWTVPASRMKMQKEHQVPLSDAAISILRAQEAKHSQNPHVFPGRPMRPLSSMNLNILVRRLGVDATIHGFRSSARSWMADTGVPFELAEQALAHASGGVVAAYQRSPMLERRRPIMAAWASYISGGDASNVVPLRA